MNFAFVLFRYFPYGGLQLDLKRIACECLARGHKVTIFTRQWDGPEIPGAECRILNSSAWTNHGKASEFEKRFLEMVKQEAFDLILGFNRMRGLDLYFAADSSFAMTSLQKNPLTRLFSGRLRTYEKQEQAVFDPASKTKILALTERQKKEYIHCWHTPKERFFLLPPGIPQSMKYPGKEKAEEMRSEVRREFQAEEKQFLLLQVCSGFRTKGVDRTLAALASLPGGLRKQCRLVIAGRDSDPERYRRMAEDLEIAKNVIFTGPRGDIAKLILGSDLMIHPARKEAAGNVLIEAMAGGLPAVCTELCGFAPIVSESGGAVLPDPFQQNDLNHLLEEILASPATLEEMRKAVLSYAEEQDFYHRQQTAVDLMEEMVRCRKSS